MSYENSKYLISVEAYHKDLKDLIEFSRRYIGRGSGSHVDNFFIGTGIAKGVEFLLQKK